MKRKNKAMLKALKIHREKMEQEGKLAPARTKVLYPKLVVRKDGKPTCFVCNNKMEDFRELRELKGTNQEGSTYWDVLKGRVSANVVCLGKMGREYPLYRCTKCEPGSQRWNKKKYLSKLSEKFNGK